MEFPHHFHIIARSDLLKDTTRMVVKFGTGVLTDSRKQPDLAQMEQLVAQVAAQCRAGREIVLVIEQFLYRPFPVVGEAIACGGLRNHLHQSQRALGDSASVEC